MYRESIKYKCDGENINVVIPFRLVQHKGTHDQLCQVCKSKLDNDHVKLVRSFVFDKYKINLCSKCSSKLEFRNLVTALYDLKWYQDKRYTLNILPLI